MEAKVGYHESAISSITLLGISPNQIHLLTLEKYGFISSTIPNQQPILSLLEFLQINFIFSLLRSMVLSHRRSLIQQPILSLLEFLQLNSPSHFREVLYIVYPEFVRPTMSISSLTGNLSVQ